MPSNRQPWPFPWALATLCAGVLAMVLWPLWSVAVLPNGGFAEQARLAAVLADTRHGIWSAYFPERGILTPMSLVPQVVAYFSPVSGVDNALRALVSVGLCLLPLTSLAYLRATGRSLWLVVAVLPWYASRVITTPVAPVCMAATRSARSLTSEPVHAYITWSTSSGNVASSRSL